MAVPLSTHHTAEQLQTKREAIYQTAREFSYKVQSGMLNEAPQVLYNEIDNLHQLLTELRKG